MKWSAQQDGALKSVAEWLKNGEHQVFRLFGFQGTGKTTLARHFSEGIEGQVLYGAYTGKAAYVLRQKGCEGATTLHSMIYHTKEKGRAHLKDLEQSLAELRIELQREYAEGSPDDNDEQLKSRVEDHRRVGDIRRMIKEERSSFSRPMFTLNMESEVKHAKLVTIDECSMVDGQMGEDLLSFGTKILVLGDPAQLPPVAGAGFFTEGVAPDVMLTDIHRQATNNPIIAMATQVREKRSLNLGDYGCSSVVEQASIDESYAQSADQILVGRNRTRHASNRRMRELLSRMEQLPVPEDKLVCLRNNHDKGLLNGAIWHVEDVGHISEDRIFMSLRPDTQGMRLDVEAHIHHFLGTERDLPWWERKEAEEFDYGYALTVHKAQGSQWNDVLLFDESYCFRRDKWRWLYTGITRAAERIVIVRV